VLEEGETRHCPAYVELHFAYLILNNPRSNQLLTWFLDVSQQKEEGPFDRPLLYPSRVIEC
jgi:hypothetical protein